MHCNKFLEYVYRDCTFCFDKRSKKSVPTQKLQKTVANVAPNLFIRKAFKVDWKKIKYLNLFL